MLTYLSHNAKIPYFVFCDPYNVYRNTLQLAALLPVDSKTIKAYADRYKVHDNDLLRITKKSSAYPLNSAYTRMLDIANKAKLVTPKMSVDLETMRKRGGDYFSEVKSPTAVNNKFVLQAKPSQDENAIVTKATQILSAKFKEMASKLRTIPTINLGVRARAVATELYRLYKYVLLYVILLLHY